MALSLSLDARAIDAALGAALLGAITEGLEDPWRLLA
jgi:pyruvate/2-oxoglutarate dehydrogenase complex dihydrolipoamide acyltransferase (E2) component